MNHGNEQSPRPNGPPLPPPPPPPSSPRTSPNSNENDNTANQDALQNALLDAQSLGEEIQKREILHKKEGKARKTKERLLNVGKSLLNLWQQFEVVHGKIEELAEDRNIPYFMDDYYSYVSEIYLRTQRLVKDDMSKLEKSKSSTRNSDQPSSATLSNKTPSTSISHQNSSESTPTQNEQSIVVKKSLIVRLERKNMLENFINKVAGKNLSEIDLIEDLEFMQGQSERYFEMFSNSHVEALHLQMQTADKTDLMQEFNDIEDSYQTVIVMLDSRISQKRKEEVEANEHQNDSLNHDSTFRSTFMNFSNNNVKLPKIEIPKFDGDSAKWPEFRDLFCSLIHEKLNVPNVQKMQYLKMNLIGSAANVIRHLQVNGAHYEAAWAALNKRYNNKKLLINNNLKRLFSQRYIKTENADELRSLLDTTKEIICTLKNLGEPVDKWNSIVVFVIAQRLPTETAALWENQTAKNECVPPLDDLESFLENRFRTIEMIEKRSAFKSSTFTKNKRIFNKNEFHCNVVENEKRTTKNCAICKKRSFDFCVLYI